MKMIPVENYGVKCMSMGLLVEKDAPIMWRGPTVMSALAKMTRGVDWGNLNILWLGWVGVFSPAKFDSSACWPTDSKEKAPYICSSPIKYMYANSVPDYTKTRKVILKFIGKYTRLCSHFERYGEITDLYKPKDHNSKQHRGIEFITFANSDSVEDLMEDTHKLGGTTLAVDRATPKEDDHHHHHSSRQPPPVARMSRQLIAVIALGGGFGAPGGYGHYDAYITAATRYAALGAPTLYDTQTSFYGRGESTRGMGNKIFVGRLPQEASLDYLRDYFGRSGCIQDAYIPKRSGHSGFIFVTLAENGVADCVARRSHEICGQEVAIDSATPLDEDGPSVGASGSSMLSSSRPEYFGAYGGGPMRGFGRMYGGMRLDNNHVFLKDFISCVFCDYGCSS